MTPPVKDQLLKLAQDLPEDATWNDVAEEVEFQRRILRGLADVEAGRVHSIDEVRRRLGLDA